MSLYVCVCLCASAVTVHVHTVLSSGVSVPRVSTFCEELPAEVSYISLLGVTSLFLGPRSGELGLGLQMGPMGPLPPTDPLRGGGGG